MLRLALACMYAGAIACAIAAPGHGASTGTSVVGATVPSATTIDTAGCRSGTANVTNFGAVVPGTGNITSSDCTIGFGSSNDTARLIASQGDGTGTAMAGIAATQTRKFDGTRLYSVDAWDNGATDVGWAAGQSGQVRYWNGSAWSAATNAGTGSLWGVAAGSSTTVWVVGSSQGIRRSINSGSTWTTQNTGTGTLNDIDMSPSSPLTIGWTVGDGGVILATGNGSAWSAQTSGTVQNLYGVVGVDDNTAVVVGNGGTILRTTNGGGTWSPVASGTTANLNAVSMSLDKTLMVAVGDSGVMRFSSNQGATWSAPPSAPVQSGYTSVSVPTNQIVVATTDNGSYSRTNNAGVGWSYLNLGWQNDGRGVASVAGTTLLSGYGMMLGSSADDGATFTVDAASFQPSLDGVFASSRSNAWVVGARGRIERTTDAGTTFTPQSSGTTQLLTDIDGIEGFLAIVGDGGTILTSANDGATWTSRTSNTTSVIRAVDVVDTYTAWATGTGSGKAWRTIDGGVTWVQSSVPSGTTSMYGISGASTLVAWASGANGYLARTTDGGSTWATITTPAAVATNTIWVSGADPSGQQVVLDSADGDVYRTTDGGATWTPVAGANGASGTGSGIAAHDTSAFAINAGAGNVIVGADGSNFTIVAGGTPTKGLTDISMPSQHAVWVVGDSYMAALIDVSANTIADFVDDAGNAAGTDWGSPTGAFFGVCLRQLTGANPDQFPVDGNNDCTATDSDPWKAVPADRASAAAVVGRTPTSGGTGTARLRFGLRTRTTTAAGTYAAAIRFEVIAPG